MLIRLQAEISSTQLEYLQQLQRKVGGKATRKDIVSNALMLLAWAARKKEEGYSIGAIGPSGKLVEFDTPFLHTLTLEAEEKRGP